MTVVETQQDRDFFDDCVDEEYPEEWDLVQEAPPQGYRTKAPKVGASNDETSAELETIDIKPSDIELADELPSGEMPSKATNNRLSPVVSDSVIPELYREDPPKPKPKRGKVIKTGLKTASELLSSSRTPLGAYREGSTVRHPEYGEGTILTLTGRGPKRTAKIRFLGEATEQTFRLAFADLELVRDLDTE